MSKEEQYADDLRKDFFMELPLGTDVPERIEAARKCAIVCVNKILESSASEYEHEDNFYRSVLAHLNNMKIPNPLAS